MNLKAIQVNKLPGVLTGQAAFSKPLIIGQPNIGDMGTFFDRVRQCIEDRMLTNNGKFVQEFERVVAKTLGVSNCIAVCNATVGLELCLRALDLAGEVIVPSFTFAATAVSCSNAGLDPVFADIRPHDHTLDVGKAEQLITAETCAIVGVHTWGNPCDIEALSALATKHDLKLIFDAAHAFASRHKGQMVGGFGDCEIFSFHATKFINSFEGGMITCNNDILADRIRSLRSFGFDGNGDIVAPGTNAKMSEVHAAMGLASLDKLGDLLATNKRNYTAYRKAFSGMPGLSVKNMDSSDQRNLQYIVVEVDEVNSPLTRDELLESLKSDNVIAKRYFWPCCHQLACYQGKGENDSTRLMEAERASRASLVMPTGETVTEEDIERLGIQIRRILCNADAIREALGQSKLNTAGSI